MDWITFSAIVAREGLAVASRLAELWADKPVSSEQIAELRAIAAKDAAAYFTQKPGLN